MKQFLIYILLSLFFINGYTQKDSLEIQYDKSVIELKKFDQKSLEKYKKNSDFYYQKSEPKESIFSEIWSWLKRMVRKFFNWLFDVEEATGLLAIVIKILPYLFLAFVLYFLIRFISKVDFNSVIYGKNKKAKVTLTEDEEIIRNQDISQLIEKAIAQKNYRLAVRYHYLLTLQKLEEKEFIVWQQQKTNDDYIQEVKHLKINSEFEKLTYLYDYIWYGNFEINENEFIKIEQSFNQLTNNIN